MIHILPTIALGDLIATKWNNFIKFNLPQGSKDIQNNSGFGHYWNPKDLHYFPPEQKTENHTFKIDCNRKVL